MARFKLSGGLAGLTALILGVPAAAQLPAASAPRAAELAEARAIQRNWLTAAALGHGHRSVAARSPADLFLTLGLGSAKTALGSSPPWGPDVPAANRPLLKCITFDGDLGEGGWAEYLVNQCTFAVRLTARVGDQSDDGCHEAGAVDIVIKAKQRSDWQSEKDELECFLSVSKLGVARSGVAAAGPSGATQSFAANWLLARSFNLTGDNRFTWFVNRDAARRSGTGAVSEVLYVSEATGGVFIHALAFECNERTLRVTGKRVYDREGRQISSSGGETAVAVKPNTDNSAAFNHACFGESAGFWTSSVYSDPRAEAANQFRKKPK